MGFGGMNKLTSERLAGWGGDLLVRWGTAVTCADGKS